MPDWQTAYERKRTVLLSDLVEPAFTVAPEMLVRDVKRRLGSTRDPINSVVVVNNNEPLGLIMSLHLDRVLSQQYGVALYHKKPVHEVMDASPLVADASQPVDTMAELAMKRERDKLFDHIIVTGDNKLEGIVTVETMLSTLASLNARRTREMREINKQLKSAQLKTEAMNRELSEAYVKLREVDQLKTDFLSMVSHELRTPLTSVLGFAEITQADLRTSIFPNLQSQDTKVQRVVRNVEKNIEIIFHEGERLTTLINDVLDIAKMEAGKVDWKSDPLDIEDVVRRALASTSSLFRKKRLQQIVTIEPDLPRIVGDSDRLIQVMVNLISNAVKFTDQGSVTCIASRDRNGVRIGVRDTGTGIKDEDRPKVFEKFKQVGDTLTNKPSGTGLGLPICKQIVEHHQGTIGVESALGEGSEFWFWLPSESVIRKTEHQAVAAFVAANGDTFFQLLAKRFGLGNGTPSMPGEPRPGVLLTYGQECVRHYLSQRCEAMGMAPHEAGTMADALSVTKRLPLAGVVFDLDSAEWHGLEMAKALRKQRRTQDVALMGLCLGGESDQGFALALDRLFIKPVKREALLWEFRFLASTLPDTPKINSRKVLVADDDKGLVDSMAALLKGNGFEVLRSMDPKESMTMAEEEAPAIIASGARFAGRHDFMRTLRFEKGLARARAVLLA